MRLDITKQLLELRYLSQSDIAEHGLMGDNLRRQFQVDQRQTGVSRLTSNIAERGQYPVHFAMAMLGFGMYR